MSNNGQFVPRLTPTQCYDEITRLAASGVLPGMENLYFNRAPDGNYGDDTNRWITIEPRIHETGQRASIMVTPHRLGGSHIFLPMGTPVRATCHTTR